MSTPRRCLLFGLPLSVAVLVACAPTEAPTAPADAVLPSFAPASEVAEGPAAPGSSPVVTDPSPTPGAPQSTRATPPRTPAGTGEDDVDGPAPDVDDGGAGDGEVVTGSIGDPTGDVRPGTPLQDPPRSVDLTGLTLTRDPTGYEVRVDLAGPAPQRRESERITNIATFYDVDGDGELDYQVYATSTDDGWGSAYFDHVRGGSAYADDDGVDVTVEDGAVVIRFPLGHLGGAEWLQWSAATQWGTFEELETGTEARDRAPDDGRGIVWPE